MSTTAEELKELDGYVSAGEFDASFVDSNVDTDMSNVIVVDNLPVVPEAKFQRLLEFSLKIFSAYGKIPEGGLCIPKKADADETEGFAFIEYELKADAEKAIKGLNGWDMDKTHKLSAMPYTDFVQFSGMAEKFTPPAIAEYKPREDLYYWLADAAARDEFVLRWADTPHAGAAHGDVHQTEVYWADARAGPTLDYAGERHRASGRVWTERQAKWSPRGTFLATFHPQGVLLWGGEGFHECRRFMHADVTDVIFSPDEKFVCTWSGYFNNKKPDNAFRVWDLRSMQLLRSFKQQHIDDDASGFSFSFDGAFLARLSTDPATGTELVHVYEMPSVSLLDQRSIRAPGARDLTWCPRKQALIAWWSPEKENVPTSVSVMKLPSRELVRQRNLFNVDGCQIIWHPDGTFLAVLAAKAVKKNKKKGDVPERKGSHGYTLEVFRLRDKGVPVEVIDFKERVHDVKWEPLGSRLAVVIGDGPTRYSVVFFSMVGTAKGAPTPILTLADKPCNALYWSPRGEQIVLAGMQNLSGTLEFYDVEQKKSFATVEHDRCSDVVWDPSGRMVASIKVQPLRGDITTRDTVENGYVLWSFQGVRMADAFKPRVYTFSWRPRPDGLLSEEEARDITKNIKKYIARVQDEDRRVEDRRRLLDQLRRRKKRDDFRALLAARHREWEAQRDARRELGADETQGEVTVIEQVVEIELEERIEIVP